MRCLCLGHQMLYAYFRGVDVKNILNIKIPEHTVIKLEPNQYGWTETHYQLMDANVCLESVRREKA